MKYLIITPYFPTKESFRGSFIYDQAMALRRAGKDVVIMLQSCGSGSDYEYGGLKVNRFVTLETPSYMFNGLFNGINSRRFLKALGRLGISPEEIEVAHCHTGPFGIYGLTLKKLNPHIKVLLQHHGKDPYTIMNGKLAGWNTNFRWRARNSINIFNAVDLHVCISEHVRSNLLAFPGAPADEHYEPYLRRLRGDMGLPPVGKLKTVTLYNGVDTSKFYPIEGRSHEGFVVGCVGNFNRLKGQLDLIRAVEQIRDTGRIKDIRLRFIGSGETYSECQRYVAEHGMKGIVEFLDERPHECLNEVFNGFDLHVMPTRFEGFGCVFAEAAACGIPFMLCRGQGGTELIADDELQYWTVEPGDYCRLADIICDYHDTHRPQRLRQSVEIDGLISEFLKEIERL